MYRVLFLIMFSILVSGNATKPQDELSPQGDTRMGTDATSSGTDLDDKDIQSQEDERHQPDTNQATDKKEIKTNGTDHGLPTN